MERSEVEALILEHMQEIITLATEYGSVGILCLAYVPGDEGYSYSVNNEYWGPNSTSSGVGRDHEHPLQAFVQVPQLK